VKRILLFAAVVGLAGMLSPKMGTAEEAKNDWCHYPSGQWTGNPDTSKVLILSIAVSAEAGHLGHSPLLSDGTTPAEGVVDVPKNGGNGCPKVVSCDLSWHPAGCIEF